MDKRILEGMNKTEIAIAHGTLTNQNLSVIFTALIKAAAVCDRYSSDILYDIEELKEGIKTSKHEDIKIQYFGIRDYGVDGMDFINQRDNDYQYIAIYAVKTANYHDTIRVTLYKLSTRKEGLK